MTISALRFTLKPNKGLYMNKWVLTVESDSEDEDSLVLNFPDDLLASVGWQPGDVIEWLEQEDGSWLLRKKNA